MAERSGPRTATALATLLVLAGSLLASNRVNKGAERVVQFQARVAAYIKLHNKARSGLPPSKPTESAEAITAREYDLAARIRGLRPNARHGDIFTPPLSAEFRHLAKMSSIGPDGRHMQTSLAHSEPVHIAVHVNDAYPANVPLQSTPPTLLQNLPPLPKELEYRLVGRRLVLRDTEANLVVDYVENFAR